MKKMITNIFHFILDPRVELFVAGTFFVTGISAISDGDPIVAVIDLSFCGILAYWGWSEIDESIRSANNSASDRTC